MNEKALRILEYNKIIEKLTDFATSPMGKEMCKNLLPSTDLGEICQGQMETSDALSRIYAKGSLSFSGLRNIRDSLLRLKVGSSLSVTEFMHIASLLETALRAKSYGRRETDDMSTDSLDGLFNTIEPLSPVCREIRRCILSEEEIADDASPGLKHVRRSIKLTNERIHSQLNTMVNSSSVSSMLQDNLITMRGGRYCLPVKAEYRSQIQGMIHDQSSSGSTLFIEPMVVVKLNNDLRELAAKEKEEIEKILGELSNQCAEYQEKLSTNITVMTHLDFVFAKANLSRSYSGTEPLFNEKGYINIKKGRHPLLDKKKVVPIDISIGKDYRLLLVTGPNTGGKTVSLKTVGLLTLMGQAGLHIPAFDHSELSVYEDVFADIGDEQSIEQSLSTFSSHMTNIVSIIDKSNYRSLVLLDELCAGTDPTEGAALAMAILKNFLRRDVTTMATTHYSELKVFALSTEGACNASCEFNVETLSPTYRLLIGIPGKSNAFAISSKLGLPDYMIDEAKKFIDVNDQSFEDLIADLETSRSTIEKERLEIEQYKSQVAGLKQKLETKQDNLSKQKERILREANEQARKILQDAKDYADQTIRDMNKLAAGKTGNMKELEKKRSAVRDKLSKTDDRLAIKKDQAKKNRPEDFHPGDSVRVLSMNIKGTITGKPNSKGQIAVQMGILKSMVSLTDLELLDEEVIKAPTLKKTGAGKIKMSKSASISTSLNIIGKTVDEAMPELDKYLDDAYLAHLNQVTIIHGRGTGKLRTAVHNKLKKCRYVKSYRLGAFGEGETGVTIVDFK
ncbi:endonuclease MutS2 [Frisingicoccus caecimuris]|uniref:Endonuclease MutS2 n=1 Tax=Frisingicoccus caecimuris TaxID=1796636 RepID=A0A4R2LFW6_9FIRM|nr:endonuclease MutS2 [Frisingicoccus caecimuris]MCR1919944.1 endonuclease MutS2 [Frisingicoccus caecimuris]TCO81838.1 DNA mismatch repair protein MutS2 [Frisingicoccus caecimuris]